MALPHLASSNPNHPRRQIIYVLLFCAFAIAIYWRIKVEDSETQTSCKSWGQLDKIRMEAYDDSLPGELFDLVKESIEPLSGYLQREGDVTAWFPFPDEYGAQEYEDEDEDAMGERAPRLEADRVHLAVEAAVLHLRESVPALGEVAWKGVEWWIQRRTLDDPLYFHFDIAEMFKDENGEIRLPTFSSILYLTEHASTEGFTLVLPNVLHPAPPVSVAAASIRPNKVSTGLLVAPRENRFVFFDGAKLHGVLSDVTLVDAAARGVHGGMAGAEAGGGGALPPGHRLVYRTTLLMNWWTEDVSVRLPDVDVLEQLGVVVAQDTLRALLRGGGTGARSPRAMGSAIDWAAEHGRVREAHGGQARGADASNRGARLSTASGVHEEGGRAPAGARGEGGARGLSRAYVFMSPGEELVDYDIEVRIPSVGPGGPRHFTATASFPLSLQACASQLCGLCWDHTTAKKRRLRPVIDGRVQDSTRYLFPLLLLVGLLVTALTVLPVISARADLIPTLVRHDLWLKRHDVKKSLMKA